MTNKQCERRLAQALGALHPKTDVSAVAGAMPAPAAATPVSVSRIHRVRRYVAAVAAASVMVAGVGTWWLTRPEDKPPVIPADTVTTTTVTTAPTEGEDTTTTTASTTVPTAPTTTDGGIVTPPTTVTSVPAPSKPTATKAPTTGKTDPPKSTSGTNPPTTGKTEPPKTTTTTGTKDKLLITGNEDRQDPFTIQDGAVADAFTQGEISPLLKQAMEQYKDTDAVFAVLVAVNPGYNSTVVNDCNRAVDAFLQSDEMVKLAAERQLAWEEYEATGKHWNTFHSLDNEYSKRKNDFKKAYLQARADEAVEVLAEFSDIPLISLYDRIFQNWEYFKNTDRDVNWRAYNLSWCKKMPDCYHYGYVAVLSADNILKLSEYGNYVFWLDSYDENAYLVYRILDM